MSVSRAMHRISKAGFTPYQGLCLRGPTQNGSLTSAVALPPDADSEVNNRDREVQRFRISFKASCLSFVRR